MKNLNNNSNVHIHPFKQLLQALFLCLTLAAAMPANAQINALNLVQRTGMDNPLDTFSPVYVAQIPDFVDLDNDGDLDCVLSFLTNTPSLFNYQRYLENTGTNNTPHFEERFSAANPFDGIPDIANLSFVDVDGDGDHDFFAAHSLTAPVNVLYYENTGSATTPAFTLRTGVNNPLDSVLHHQNAFQGVDTVYPYRSRANFSFVDYDNDSDIDCFVTIHENPNTTLGTGFWYYQNQGTNTNPIYQRITNPVQDTLGTSSDFSNYPVQFLDVDNDNDFDLHSSRTPNHLYENTGTASNPVYTNTNIQILDSTLYGNGTHHPEYTFVDIDKDGDIDVFLYPYGVQEFQFWENITYTSVSELQKAEHKDFNAFPNPTSGKINFDRTLSGILRVYSSDGRAVISRKVNNINSMSLQDLSNGLYYIIVQAEEDWLRTTVLIER